MVIHLHQLGSTTAVETPKIRDGEQDQLLGALTKEATMRNKNRKEHIEKLEAKQLEFLTKCGNLTQTILPGEKEAETNKPLERSYQLLESVMSNLQTRLQTKKDEKKEETSALLRHPYTTFTEANKVLQEDLEESVTVVQLL